VASDVVGAQVLVNTGRLDLVFVGGSLVGGTIFADSIGQATVLGDILGAGDGSGVLSATGDLGPVFVGGSLVGGDGPQTGFIRAGANLGLVRIRGSIRGGRGSESGTVEGGDTLAGVRVGGSLRGGTGPASGRIASFGNIGAIVIRGDVDNRGTVSLGAGSIASGGRIGGVVNGVRVGVRIGGSLIGGGAAGTGLIEARVSLANLEIGGDLVGGDLDRSGQVLAGRIGAVRVGGSLIGGAGILSGSISSQGTLGRVFIRGDMLGGIGSRSASLSAGGRIAAVTVNGSIRTGSGERSASIQTGANLGPILVRGSLIGRSDQLFVLSAVGEVDPPPGQDLAIASLTVLGRVEFVDILAGYSIPLFAVNGDAQIGAVQVGGDWVSSNLTAGVEGGPDGRTGTADDRRAGGEDNPSIVASVAGVTIGGQVLGSIPPNDIFAFVAERFGSFSVGGTLLPLNPGARNDVVPLGATLDVVIREV
jgi:hypothetical protein